MDYTDYPDPLEALLDPLSSDIKAVTERLAAKTITVEAWRAEMERLIARYMAAAVMAGLGAEELTPNQATVVQQGVTIQRAFLDKFVADMIAEGWETGSFPAKWMARADMYARSIVAPFWEGETWGLPLPAMPGDMTSQCGQNDKCTWEIVTLSEKRGDFDAYWVLHPAEHCQSCLVRSEEWNPLRIRNWTVMIEGRKGVDDILVILADELQKFKHLQGRHDQKKHGYRYGSAPTPSRARDLKKSGLWEDYRRRARGNPTDEEYNAAQANVRKARDEYAKKMESHKTYEETDAEWQAAQQKHNDAQKNFEDEYNRRQAKLRELETETDRLLTEWRNTSYGDKNYTKAMNRYDAASKKLDKARNDLYGKYNGKEYVRPKWFRDMEKARDAALEELRSAEQRLFHYTGKEKFDNAYLASISGKDLNAIRSRLYREAGKIRADYARREKVNSDSGVVERRKKKIDDLQEQRSKIYKDHPNDWWKEPYSSQVSAITEKLRGLQKVSSPGIEVARSVAVDRLKRAELAANTEEKPAFGSGQYSFRDGVIEIGGLLAENPILSSKRNTVSYEQTLDRGHYSGSKKTVVLSETRGTSTHVHELGHHIEEVDPLFHKLALEHLNARTAGEMARKLKEIEPRSGYEDYEISTPDKFFDPYVGKQYGQFGKQYATEVLSMGFQEFYSNPARLAKRDPELFDFIYFVGRIGLK